MVKQLDIPTFFLTLSCADLKWDELTSIIHKLNNFTSFDDDLKNTECKYFSKKYYLVVH